MIQDKYEKIHACDAIRCNNKKNIKFRLLTEDGLKRLGWKG
jgi:hypothetical protein